MPIYLAQAADEVSGLVDSVERLETIGSFTILAVLLLAGIFAYVLVSGRWQKLEAVKAQADSDEKKAVNTTVTTLARNSDRLFEEFSTANAQGAKTREALSESQKKLIELTERQVAAQEAQTVTQSKQADTSAALMQSFSTLSEIVPTILGLNTVMTEFEAVRLTVGKFEKPDDNLVLVLQKMATDIDAIKAFNEKRREIDIQTASLLRTVNASLVSIKERLNQIPGMPKAAPETPTALDVTTLQKVKLEGTIGEIADDPTAA